MHRESNVGRVLFWTLGVILAVALTGSGETAAVSFDQNLLKTGLGIQANPDPGQPSGVEAQKFKVLETYKKLPLYFIENPVHKDKGVKYYARARGQGIFCTPKELVLRLSRGAATTRPYKGKDSFPGSPEQVKNRNPQPEPQGGALVRLNLFGLSNKVHLEAVEPTKSKVNCFIGSDPQKWRTDIPTFRAVVYRQAYPGVDLKVYGTGQELEYDIIVQPTADPGLVKFQYKGIKGLEITESGDLVIKLPAGGELVQKKPVAYQEIEGRRIPREARFLVQDTSRHIYGFALAEYDKSYPLIIDPVLVYSTFLGGNDRDYCTDIAVDGSGNVYVTGSTAFGALYLPGGQSLPVTDGAFDTSFGGPEDTINAFVTKFDQSGNLVYSTYLGGSGGEGGRGIAVDSSGHAYVTGGTGSSDFPTTPGAYDPSYNGRAYGKYINAGDAFVTKLDPTGSSLVYSTFLGGTAPDEADDVAVDASGNAYLTGMTLSSDFPTTTGAFDTTWDGDRIDAFVAKLDSTGSSLEYSTYLGGDVGGISQGKDMGHAIAVDGWGNAYVTGETWATNFPTTPGSYDTIFNGVDSDVFITKLNAMGSGLVYSTYLGGSELDYGQDIAVDAAGHAFVTGVTRSTDFPTTPGAFDETPNSPSVLWPDGFVVKLDVTGSSLLYSTILGGTGDDRPDALALDPAGNVYVTGFTYRNAGNGLVDFPLTPDAIDNYLHTFSRDVFVMKLGPAGSTLLYSTFLGGKPDDEGRGLGVDGSGNVWVAGNTQSPDFPTTPDAFDNTFNPGASASHSVDVFVAKLDLGAYTLNRAPVAEAGENIFIQSEDLASTALQGTASDADNDPLQFRWLEAETVLLDWTPVENGNCCLNLGDTSLAVGTHTLTLQVSDGQVISSDQMVLTIGNSSPNGSILSGSGTYPLGSEVILQAEVSDFDGDLLSYRWQEGNRVFDSGSIQTLPGGETVQVPDCMVSDLPLGSHTITLLLDDGVNDPVGIDTIIEISDDSAPTLAPSLDKSILWPPNHEMVQVSIIANATDNSGMVTLSAEVTSNEPQDGLGDGDTSPDWTEPVIYQDTGIVTLQLRAERSGNGKGREYKITITATDPSGNFSKADIVVLVPHDKRNK